MSIPTPEVCRSSDEAKPGGICGEAAAYMIRIKTRTADVKSPACERHHDLHNQRAMQMRHTATRRRG